MDEPTSAIDPIATAKIEELIHTLKLAYTIVSIVTHNMQQAARVSDYTAFFWQGRNLRVLARPRKSLATPRTKKPKTTLPAVLVERVKDCHWGSLQNPPRGLIWKKSWCVWP